VRITESHRRDFELYEKFSNMTPMWPHREPNDPDGLTPLECFVLLDSQGKGSPCNDTLKLRQVQHGKQMVNLQIKMWVETTMEDPLQLMPFEVREWTREYPDWVFKSYIKRLERLMLEKNGYVPAFVTKT
jgi:hypothetical protein